MGGPQGKQDREGREPPHSPEVSPDQSRGYRWFLQATGPLLAEASGGMAGGSNPRGRPGLGSGSVSAARSAAEAWRCSPSQHRVYERLGSHF